MRLRSVLAFAAAAIVLIALWNLPVEAWQVRWSHALALPVEAGVLLVLPALVPALRKDGRAAFGYRLVGASATTGAAVLLLLDALVRASLGRPLSPWLDLHLAPSLMHLLSGSLVGMPGWLAPLGLALVPLVIFALAWLVLRAAQRGLRHRRLRRPLLAGLGLLALSSGAAQLWPDTMGDGPRLHAHASATVSQQAKRTRDLLAEADTFARLADDDRPAAIGDAHILAGLGGADVLLMFVESYGRSALEDPRYAAKLRPRLKAFDRRIAEAGLSAASGWLTSPTVGGQSWLAHASVQSGLWISHHRLYQLLLTAERSTLTDAFRRAGYRTVAVKPAIVRPWPEGRRFGYDRILAAADLGYAGLPFNWVTMPDQYTLSVLERLERRAGTRPLFAEVSLISSHAPWTPIPPVLGWSEIGDGRVFSRWANEGDPPEVLWRDTARVREHYALALDYVLAVLASYAERFVDEETLLILLGDHQSAPLITGEGASRDVPMHVVSRDPDLIAPFRRWGFTPGMLPGDGEPVARMDAFRDWFIEAFSPAPADDEPAAARAPRPEDKG